MKIDEMSTLVPVLLVLALRVLVLVLLAPALALLVLVLALVLRWLETLDLSHTLSTFIGIDWKQLKKFENCFQ